MEIFIGNLPADGKLVELNALLDGLRLHTRFEVFSGKDGFANNYHYFVVQTDNDAQGQALIERLNATQFHNNTLTVREFIRRGKTTTARQTWSGKDRRINAS